MSQLKYLFISLLLHFPVSASAKNYNASYFGIKSDGTTLNTGTIQKAIDYISENGGGKLTFYVGRYLTGTLLLKSNVAIQLEEGAILVATTSVYDYTSANGPKALITADGAQHISLSGKGVIEGNGAKLLARIQTQIKKGYLQESEIQAKPALVALNNCTSVSIEQLNLVNSCGDVVSLSTCRSVSISGAAIKSKEVKGANGIIITGCNDLRLENLFIDTSGREIVADSGSTAVKTTDCKNKNGQQLAAEPPQN